MLDLIAYILIRALNKAFSIIPVSFSLWLAGRFGGPIFFFNKKRRLIAYANLKAAFAGEKSPSELRKITKQVYVNLAQTFVEILNLTKVNKSYVDRYVEVVNMERIENASRSGRSTILLTAHFGDWELSSIVSAIKGFPILVLAREQKMKRVNELLNQLRESKGCKVVRKGISTKNILKALHTGEIVGILSDQDAGRNGTFVELFGRATSTHSGAMEMAKRAGSIILPNFIVREKGPYHKLFLEEYIDLKEIKGEGDIKKAVQKYASVLEKYVRKYPDQWLWLHKRWKSTPVRTVLVLNDGKAGHLNQSLSVANQIRAARTTQGYSLDDTKIEVVDVKHKSNFSKTILSLCAALSGWRCHGRMNCMRACLPEDTYKKLMGTYAEFIVSCGSSLAGVNIFMKWENNAKNIVIMKPQPFLALNKFDLAVIPRHDNPPKRKNVVVTTLAPNLSKEAVAGNMGGKKTIGLLLGGDNPEFSLTKELAGEVTEGILKICDEYDGQIAATTSRRTNSEVERFLKERLKDDPRCASLIIANEDNPEGAMKNILASSDILVVSGESISMVSEAVSAGKKTVVFELKKKSGKITKHERALKGLEKEDYLAITSPEDLESALKAALEDNRPVKRLDDNKRIFDSIRRLV